MTKDPIRPSEALPLGADASAELQPLFGDPTNDWAALYEIADVIRKALRDPEFVRLANEPDTDKSSRVEGEDTPESAHMRCVSEEAINAVLNRIKIRSIKFGSRRSHQSFGPHLPRRLREISRMHRRRQRLPASCLLVSGSVDQVAIEPGSLRGDEPRPASLCGRLETSQPETW
jgi:hypothetical protein